MEVHVSEQIRIDAPIETVWSFIEDPQKELEWRGSAITELEQLDDGPIEPGTRYRGASKVGPGSAKPYVNEVSAVQPPAFISWRDAEGEDAVGGGGSYRLERDGEGTVMHIDLTYEALSLTGFLMLAAIKVMGPRTVRQFLETLKSVAERDAARERVAP